MYYKIVKILYGVQTMGNGHIARAKEIIPELKKHADVDIILSGPQAALDIGFPVKYVKPGFILYSNDKGGIDYTKTLIRAKVARFFKDIINLDLSEYDLVVSDFEIISIWATRLQDKKCIGIANQYSYLSPKIRKKLNINLAMLFYLKIFAKCDKTITLCYKTTAANMYTPIIRKEIRDAKISEENHITVYLSAYNDRILINTFSKIKDHDWHIFTKYVKQDRKIGNVILKKIDNNNFVDSFVSSKGVVTGGGFTTTSEAIYLGKKLLIIPRKKDPEQMLNAYILSKMGVKNLKKIKRNFADEINDWFKNWPIVKMDYPDVVPNIVKVIVDYANSQNNTNKELQDFGW